MSVRNDLQGKLSQSNAYLRRVVGASMAGTALEWYEFSSTAPRPHWSSVRSSSPRAATSSTHPGRLRDIRGRFRRPPAWWRRLRPARDGYGRKKLLRFSLLLVGFATFAMGCLPTFGQIGYWAPALPVVLRFFQASPSAANGAEPFFWLPSTDRSPAADSGPAGRRPVCRAETCRPRRYCWSSPRRSRMRNF